MQNPAIAPSSQPQQAMVLRKVIRRLFPLVFLGYFFSFLDRVNIGFASLQMNAALDLTPAVFAFGAGVFFISYVTLEVPSNLIMERVGARVWLGRILISWGLLSALTACIVGPHSFYLIRFLLGAAEAGWVPGLFLYLCYWFPASFRARSQLLFLLGAPISIIVGGPISGWIMDTAHNAFGISGWRWLFILQGVPAVLLGIIWLFVTSDRPETATWLSADERRILTDAIQSDPSYSDAHGKHGKFGAFKEPRVLFLCVVNFIWCIGFYGFVIWTPQIIKQVSLQTNYEVGLAAAIPSLLGAVAMYFWASHSDRKRERRLHAATSMVVAGGGLCVAAYASGSYATIAALSIISIGLYAYLGTFWSLVSESLSSQTAAGGFALVVAVGNIGGFVGPFFLGVMRQYTGDFRMAMVGTGVTVILGGLLAVSMKCTKPTGLGDIKPEIN